MSSNTVPDLPSAELMVLDQPDATVTDAPAPTPTASAPRRARPSIDVRALLGALLLPTAGVLAFLALWGIVAPQVDTALGTLPGPVEVAQAGSALVDEWVASNQAEEDFYAEQVVFNAQMVAEGTPDRQRAFIFSGPPTFVDQVWTSLKTVAFGFVLASLFAIPIGLLAGLSRRFNAAINPLVQVMKPVSPLAWLPIVTMIISATVTSADPILPKSFIVSALVVSLCSLWPTLINTAVGTQSIDTDLLNVSRVLRLTTSAKLRKIVLPASMPYIFTGLRLSLGVGWMVLIAAEMLAQNPGLGKFVWDEFQNGSSQSLSRIMFAVLVIGLIGFLLDRLMSVLQDRVSRTHA